MLTLTLTGKLGNTPSCLGAVVLAYVPLVDVVIPPVPTPSGGSLPIPSWKRRQIEKDKRKREEIEEKRRREKQEEDDVLAILLTIIADED